jgi:hypothetical protein
MIYAFQITRFVIHDVKAYGFMNLLELSGLMNETLNGKIQLILEFFIPQGLGDKFRKSND